MSRHNTNNNDVAYGHHRSHRAWHFHEEQCQLHLFDTKRCNHLIFVHVQRVRCSVSQAPLTRRSLSFAQWCLFVKRAEDIGRWKDISVASSSMCAESTVSPCVFLKSNSELLFTELRPVHIRKMEFSVCQLSTQTEPTTLKCIIVRWHGTNFSYYQFKNK